MNVNGAMNVVLHAPSTNLLPSGWPCRSASRANLQVVGSFPVQVEDFFLYIYHEAYKRISNDGKTNLSCYERHFGIFMSVECGKLL